MLKLCLQTFVRKKVKFELQGVSSGMLKLRFLSTVETCDVKANSNNNKINKLTTKKVSRALIKRYSLDGLEAFWASQ